MNNNTAKKIRQIIPPTDKLNRRVYRRAKRAYVRLSSKAKPIFLMELKQAVNGLSVKQ